MSEHWIFRRRWAHGAARWVLVAVLLGLAASLAGCAGGGGRSVLRTTPKPPPGLSRDDLLSVVAACHLLRVGQNLDNRVTDATVVAAVDKYRYDYGAVIQRATQILAEYQSRGPALAREAARACANLSNATDVRPALVRLEENGRPRAVWLRVDGGEINEGFADRVIRQLRDKKAVGLIINSPGGSVFEARKLGQYLRANGLRTAVDRTCVSACIDVLAGGAERYVTRDARLGVHQSKVPDRYSSHEGGQRYVADSFRYLREMGVDPDVAIAAASIPNDKLLLIRLSDALETGLVTAVVDHL